MGFFVSTRKRRTGMNSIQWTDIALLVIGAAVLAVLGYFIWRLANELLKRLGADPNYATTYPRDASDDDTLGIESMTPSLDGTEGGWRLTKTFSLLVVLIIFLIPFVTVSVNLSKSLSHDPAATDSTQIKQKNDTTGLTTGAEEEQEDPTDEKNVPDSLTNEPE
jgi:hypothetical protein